MLLPNTLFVLGAAVSKEFGMPLGGTLKGMIRAALKDNARNFDELNEAIFSEGDPAANSAAVKHIAEAMLVAASIDNLVEHLRHNERAVRVAKLAIAACILQAEGGSDLHVPDRQFGLPGKAYNTTLGAIFRLIIGNLAADDIQEAFARVRFITFNYDRTLEWFLLNALISHSGLPLAEAVKIVGSLPIIHAYGSIGDLGWLTVGGGGIDFGAAPTQNRIISGAERVKTFSEERHSLLKHEINAVVGAADRIIILGCYPHPQNLELLRPPHHAADELFMTTYIPAPVDPDGYSSPSMAEFAAPARGRLVQEFNSWGRSPEFTGTFDLHIEPSTSLQMVDKWGSSWLTLGA